MVYSYCEFDVTLTGQLTIKIWARYKHWGQSFGDWVLKDTITDGWTVGNHYLSPDTVVWQLTFWCQFCTIEVKWEIWSGGDCIDTYSESYSREPSGDIFNAYVTLEDDTEIHYDCWYSIYQWGNYELKVFYRLKPYGSSTWGDWILCDSYQEYYDTTSQYHYNLVYQPLYWQTIEVEFRLSAREGSTTSYSTVGSEYDDYFRGTPDADVLGSSYVYQSWYDQDWDSQRTSSKMRFSISVEGQYTFELQAKHTGLGWYFVFDQTLWMEVGSYPTSGYEKTAGWTHGLYPHEQVTWRWTIRASGVIVHQVESSVFSVLDPAIVHADSYIYQSAPGAQVASYAKFYLYASGTYWIKVEYKKPGDSSYTVKRSGTQYWSTTGMKTITDYLFWPTQDGLCYVRWTIYDSSGSGSEMYWQRTESLYIYKFQKPFPLVGGGEDDQSELEDLLVPPYEPEELILVSTEDELIMSTEDEGYPQ